MTIPSEELHALKSAREVFRQLLADPPEPA